jgi:arsenate reductase (thioredoxin)
MNKKPLVYFLCTGNSCRSQMAHGWLNEVAGDQYEVQSAGIEAHGLNPRAVQAMQEVGVDISHHTSDVIDPETINRADYVITLCGDANDKCPITPPHVKRWHWGFDDPARAQGTEEEKWAVFRRVRDEIGERMKRFAREGE